jgi:hypothetical protein
MKVLRSLLLICAAILLAGCSTLYVFHDYDPDIDFAALKSYKWLTIPKNMRKYELTIKHIRRAVNRGLESEGLTMSREDPDILIAVHGGIERKVNVEEWGYKHGRIREFDESLDIKRYDVYKRRGVDVYEYMEGTLILDLVDAHTKELIWRGKATWTSSIGPTREDIDRIVEKLLEEFPPLTE